MQIYLYFNGLTVMTKLIKHHSSDITPSSTCEPGDRNISYFQGREPGPGAAAEGAGVIPLPAVEGNMTFIGAE